MGIAIQIEYDISLDAIDDTLIRYGRLTPKPKPNPMLSMSLVEAFEYRTREYRENDCDRQAFQPPEEHARKGGRQRHEGQQQIQFMYQIEIPDIRPLGLS